MDDRLPIQRGDPPDRMPASGCHARHSREGGNPVPAAPAWIPAFAGMTDLREVDTGISTGEKVL